MYCPNCNHPNDESSRFCSKCGEYLEKKPTVHCPDCNTEKKSGDTFCATCGYKYENGATAARNMTAFQETSTQSPSPGSDFGAQHHEVHHTYNNGFPAVKYANFGERLVASLIDGVIISIAGFVIGMLFGEEEIGSFLSLFVSIAYKAGMESSVHQGTLGKKAIGIRVVGPDGGRISVGRAIGRYFARVLSVITLYIGYLMALFTKEKRTLHDFIAGTYVVKN